jgi:cyclopropane fatty-acyl-phospholipid synthase-like methyltransferase
MLELAARYVPEMQTIHSDMRTVEFDAERFDAITAVYSLFHVPAEEHSVLFEKFQRWLRPGGKVLFTYATREYTGSDEFDGCKEFLGKQLYYSHKTPERLCMDLECAGLEVESLDYRDIGGEVFLWVTACRAV